MSKKGHVIASVAKQSRQVTGNVKIATGLSAPHNDNKKGNVIANEVKQSRQTLLRPPDGNQDLVKSRETSSSARAGDPVRRRRHPEFISGSTNGSIWTLRQAQSDGTESFIKLDSRMLTHSRMTERKNAMTGKRN